MTAEATPSALDRIRRRTLNDDDRSGWEYEVAYYGLDGCPTPAVRSAWLKGWQAHVDGRDRWDNPYRVRDRRDRKGRLNEGFRGLYRRAWSLGHAWAEHLHATDDFETHSTVQALAGLTWDGRRNYGRPTAGSRRR